MIEPLRYNVEIAPPYAITKPIFCAKCLTSKKTRDNPGLAIKYCKECPRYPFLCEVCDDVAHGYVATRCHQRRILVIGPAVRKKVIRRGDSRTFPQVLDTVEIKFKTRIYQHGKILYREPTQYLVFPSGTSGQNVHIQILGCRNLPIADAHGASDPFVCVSYNHKTIGTTRTRPRTVNPRWLNETYILPCNNPEKLSTDIIKLEVFDRDYFNFNDFLGHIEFTGKQLLKLAQVSDQKPIRLNLTLREFHGNLNLSFLLEKTTKLVMKIVSGDSLDKMNAFGLSDPFCMVYFHKQYLGKTGVINNTINPVWTSGNVFNIDVATFIAAEKLLESTAVEENESKSDHRTIVRIEVFDHNTFRKHAHLGTVRVTAEQIRKLVPHMARNVSDIDVAPTFTDRLFGRRISTASSTINRARNSLASLFSSNSQYADVEHTIEAPDPRTVPMPLHEMDESVEGGESASGTPMYLPNQSIDSLIGSLEMKPPEPSDSESEEDMLLENKTPFMFGGGDKQPSVERLDVKSSRSDVPPELLLRTERNVTPRVFHNLPIEDDESDYEETNEDGGTSGMDATSTRDDLDDEETASRQQEMDVDEASPFLEEESTAVESKSGGFFEYLKNLRRRSTLSLSSLSSRRNFSAFRRDSAASSTSTPQWSIAKPFAVTKESSKNVADEHNLNRGQIILRLIPSSRGHVIRGLDLAVQKMTLGETSTVKVRYDYCYGNFWMGSHIPPRSNMVFTVKLVSINGSGGTLWMPWRQLLRFTRMLRRTARRTYNLTMRIARGAVQLKQYIQEKLKKKESVVEEEEESEEDEDTFSYESEEKEEEEESEEEEEIERTDRERMILAGSRVMWGFDPSKRPKKPKKAKLTPEELEKKRMKNNALYGSTTIDDTTATQTKSKKTPSVRSDHSSMMSFQRDDTNFEQGSERSFDNQSESSHMAPSVMSSRSASAFSRGSSRRDVTGPRKSALKKPGGDGKESSRKKKK